MITPGILVFGPAVAPTGIRLVLACLITAVLYGLAGRLGLLLAIVGDNISPIWPSIGIGLAAMLLWGPAIWPGIALGVLLTNVEDLHPLAMLLIMAGNTGGIFLAWLILGAIGRQGIIGLRSLARFLAAVAIGPLCSSSVGILGLVLVGDLRSPHITNAWHTWYLGDVMGLLLVTPLLGLLPGRQTATTTPWSWLRRAEGLLVAILLVCTAMLAFSGPDETDRVMPAAFLLFPLVLWSSERFGLPGAVLTQVTVAAIAIAGTSLQQGPFSDFDLLPERFLALHALLAAVALTGLVQGAAACDRRRTEGDLLLASSSVAAAHDLILWLDARGHLVHANPSAVTRLGRPLDSLVGLPMNRLAEKLGSGSWRHASEGDCTPVQESALIAGDGTRIPVEVSLTRVRDPRLPGVYTCAIARDLTERRSLEGRLAQAGKMEALGRMAGGVAHDFNNVLTVINGYAESAQGHQDLPPRVVQALGHIRTAGERAAGMTRQLLAFSRQQAVSPRRIDLNRVADEALPLVERLVGAQVRCQLVKSPLPARVLADPGQIHQVLMNLAANARDALAGAGTLYLDLTLVDLDPQAARMLAHANPHDAEVVRAGSFVRLTVRDDGPGMPPEVRVRLFEPFFTTKAEGQGTGLGLSSVHGIVRQSHGFIIVEGEPGTGMSFAIHLPHVDGHDESGPRHPAVVGRALRLLVVDDQPLIRDLVASQLRSAGHTIKAATSASEALAVVDHEPCDVLVTDVAMPGMAGPALAEILRTRQPGLGVVFISGFPEGHLPDPLPPRTRFLSKPFQREDLLAAVLSVAS